MAKVCAPCRTCNTERSDYINLAHKAPQYDGLSFFDVLFAVCPSLSTPKHDRLPQNICLLCSKQLEAAYEFHLQCTKAHAELLQMLEATPSEEFQPYFPKKSESDDKPPIEEDCDSALNEEMEILEDNDDLENFQDSLKHEPTSIESIYLDGKESSEEIQEIDYKHPLPNKHEAQYMCCHCDKKFFTTRGLHFHEKLTHKNLKPILTNAEILTIECKYCLQVFERQIELMMHCRTEHRVELAKDLTCTICQKTFTGKNKYEHHLLYHAKSQFQCFVKGCSRTFVIKYKLTDHLKRFHGIALTPSQTRTIKPQSMRSPQQ